MVLARPEVACAGVVARPAFVRRARARWEFAGGGRPRLVEEAMMRAGELAINFLPIYAGSRALSDPETCRSSPACSSLT